MTDELRTLTDAEMAEVGGGQIFNPVHTRPAPNLIIAVDTSTTLGVLCEREGEVQ